MSATLPVHERNTAPSLAALEDYFQRRHAASVQIDNVCELGGGSSGAAALKAFGYGRPLCIDYRLIDDGEHDGSTPLQRVVLRQVQRNGFGRERESDRIGEIWLDWTTFNHLPRHVRASDIVALTHQGTLASMAQVVDLLLVTDYAAGDLYADDFARIRDTGTCTMEDLARGAALADYLADIHAVKHDEPLLWRRRLRDLIGHGEGIMGLCDSYPNDFTLAMPADLLAIEVAANVWRWRLKPLHARLSQVHGDFHPFNVLFSSGTEFQVLDRSRGAWGEPADDLSCMTINYLFFSLQRSGILAGPFEQLYDVFWTRYLERTGDDALCSVIAPWFAWRALVLASPQWYPALSDDVRRKLLTFARRVLTTESFDWANINGYLEAA